MASTARKTAAKLHKLATRQVQHAGDGDHGDGGGLILRIRGESAAWVFRYTSPAGRRRELGLGTCWRNNAAQAGDSVATARAAAHTARAALLQGLDPIDLRDQGRQQAKAAEVTAKQAKAAERWTLARCARDYHARVIEPNRTAQHSAQWLASLENHIPAAVWNRPVGDVDAPELLQAILAIKPHERARNMPAGSKLSETTKRIRQRLEAVFEDAVFHKRCSANPAAALRRKLQEAAPKRQAGHFKALPYPEAPALLAKLREAPGTAARCLEFAVLCAARTSEALEAEWSEIDLEKAIWIVPASRMKSAGKAAPEDHTVHLSQRAVAIIKGQAGQDARWVFPSTARRTAQMSNMALLTTLDRLGARQSTTVHGLCRATFSTWANETGAARPDVVEACLAHKEGDKVRRAYNRASFAAERRALLEAWAAYLAAPPAQVLPFPQAA
jgi:integrase